MQLQSSLQNVAFNSDSQLLKALPVDAITVLESLMSSGSEVLEWAVKYLQETLQMDFAFVGAMAGADFEHVQTLRVCKQGEMLDNFAYDLQGTPCNDVKGRDVCYCLSDVVKGYPDDQMLHDMGLESYIGIGLYGGDGNPIGIVVLLSESTINESTALAAEALLRILRPRLEAELTYYHAMATMQVAMSEPEGSESTLEHLVTTIAHSTRMRVATLYEGELSAASCAPIASCMDGVAVTDATPLPPLLATTFGGSEGVSIAKGAHGVVPIANIGSEPTEALFVLPLHQPGEPALGTLVLMHDRKVAEAIESRELFRLLRTRLRAELLRRRAEAGRERLQASLADARRSESVAALASGIAHDFNNLTFVMSGQAQLIRRLAESEQGQHMADIIVEAADRAQELCEQLMTYAGRRVTPPAQVDMNALVAESSRLNGVLVASKGHLELDCSEGELLVYGIHTEIQQALMNLVKNAADASSGGKIHVATRGLHLSESDLAKSHVAEDCAPGEYIALSVSDQGAGMTAAQISAIVAPYYTTKETGHGLGLSVVLNCVRNHRAALRIESTPGEGSTFTISFPRGAATPRLDTGEQNTRPVPTTANRILVIDDEEMVRNTLSDLLATGGTDVELAADADTGITLFAASPGRYDVVLVDYEMPGKKGDAAIAALRELSPSVPIVLMSANMDRAKIADFPVAPDAYLRKPFLIEELWSAIADLESIAT